MKALVLIAALMVAPVFAESNNQGRAHLDFRIVIPKIVRANAATVSLNLSVTDILRGYVEVEQDVLITSNTHDGFMINASYNTTALTKVDVTILGQTLTSSSGYGNLFVRSDLLNNAKTTVKYRLYLSPSLKAGTYNLPVSLIFSTWEA